MQCQQCARLGRIDNGSLILIGNEQPYLTVLSSMFSRKGDSQPVFDQQFR
jgi:hypothetical protein